MQLERKDRSSPDMTMSHKTTKLIQVYIKFLGAPLWVPSNCVVFLRHTIVLLLYFLGIALALIWTSPLAALGILWAPFWIHFWKVFEN